MEAIDIDRNRVKLLLRVFTAKPVISSKGRESGSAFRSAPKETEYSPVLPCQPVRNSARSGSTAKQDAFSPFSVRQITASLTPPMTVSSVRSGNQLSLQPLPRSNLASAWEAPFSTP